MRFLPSRTSRTLLAVALLGLAVTGAAAERKPSRFALWVEGGTAWESHDPQSFLLTDSGGREPQLEYDRGGAWGVGVDIQINELFVARGVYETAAADLSMTLFPPPGIADDSLVASTRYEAYRAGVFFHGLLRRDLFDPKAETRTMGRFGISVGRAGLTDAELPSDLVEAFGIVRVSTRKAWLFALEAEWVARLGRSRWFAGVGVSIGVGPGPKLVLEPGPGSGFLPSEFEYRPNRLVARLGYRF